MSQNVVASVTLKSRSGMSVFRDADKFTFSRLDDFRPRLHYVDQVIDRLLQAGFTIVAQTAVGVSFAGPKELFESEFGVAVQRREVELARPGRRVQRVSFLESSHRLMMSDRISPIADAVQLAIPGIPFHTSTAPSPGYYFLRVLTDVPALLNASALHTAGITGSGVRVSMVDTGFVTRVTEAQTSTSASQVTTAHTIRQVHGVWLASDPGHAGTNYYTGGSFAGAAITLGTALPGSHTNVQVVYSCLHPHYLAQGYTFDDIRAVGGLDVNTDEYGHGTAEAANVLAVAPGSTFSFVKYSDGGWSNFPLAGFQAAVQHQTPDIITCSWGTGAYDAALHLEVANAVANGIVVIFAGGNGHDDNPASWSAKVVAHPRLISVGGAYPISGGGFRASNYASSFDSFMYTSPQRHVPDLVGLVGETPIAALIMLPTEPDNTMDNDLSCSGGSHFPDCDETASNDGWCVCSGTSAAAPQTAGVAALLLQQYPSLKPEAVKHILENSARDITTGTTNSAGPDSAVPGWDPATGFGLIDAQAAVNFLQPGVFNAYIRDSIEDNGTEPVVANRLYASPDIVVRQAQVSSPQDELGQTVKHRYDLSDDVELGLDNWIYLRLQNRGTLTDDCTARVYVTEPGMFSNPAAWTLIGQTNVASLEPGEFRVVGPIQWSAALIPATGHYCLISILDSTADPAPDLTTIHTTQDFVDMVRDRNNVAWKNINIVDLVPGGYSSFSFYMQGPAGSGHRADLEVDLSGFVSGGEVLVKVVKRLLNSATLQNLSLDRETQLFKYLHHSGGLGALRGMDFQSNEQSQVTVYYSIPTGAASGNYPIVARLFVDGGETGGYTEIARVFSFTFVGNRISRELHRAGCPWEQKMSPRNRVAFADVDRAHRQGFDNCAVCLGGSLR